MISAGIHEAKTHLSRLLKEVEKGEEVYIKRGNKPVAKLVPCTDEPLLNRRPRAWKFFQPSQRYESSKSRCFYQVLYWAFFK